MTLNLIADPERVKHLLITARDELLERGWTQGVYGTHDGPKCTLGALSWADNGTPAYIDEPSPELQDAEWAIRAVIGTPFIGCWNDEITGEEGRTIDEVVAAFDGAIGLVDGEIERRRSVAEVQRIAHLAGVETEAASGRSVGWEQAITQVGAV